MVERVLYVAPLAASRKTTSRYSGWMPLRMRSRYGSAGERAGLGHTPGRNGLQRRHRAGQRDQLDLRAAQRYHLPVRALVRGDRRVQAEPGGQDPVERRRRPSALHVAEHGGAHLLAGAPLQLLAELLGDPGEPAVPVLVDPT